MQQAGMSVINKGLAPLHRKALAHVKRLAKAAPAGTLVWCCALSGT
jgi:hypothetical protein